MKQACDDGLLLLWCFISIFHILLPSISSSLSVSIGSGGKTTVLHTHCFIRKTTHTRTHYSKRTDNAGSLFTKIYDAVMSKWKSYKWKHTHAQHVICSYTICQVIKAASNYVTQNLAQPDKHMHNCCFVKCPDASRKITPAMIINMKYVTVSLAHADTHTHTHGDVDFHVSELNFSGS